jgi:hypothetical protein
MPHQLGGEHLHHRVGSGTSPELSNGPGEGGTEAVNLWGRFTRRNWGVGAFRGAKNLPLVGPYRSFQGTNLMWARRPGVPRSEGDISWAFHRGQHHLTMGARSAVASGRSTGSRAILGCSSLRSIKTSA